MLQQEVIQVHFRWLNPKNFPLSTAKEKGTYYRRKWGYEPGATDTILLPQEEGLTGNKDHTEGSTAGSLKENPRVNAIYTSYLLLCNELPQNKQCKATHWLSRGSWQECSGTQLGGSRSAVRIITRTTVFSRLYWGKSCTHMACPQVTENPLPSLPTWPLAGLRFLVAGNTHFLPPGSLHGATHNMAAWLSQIKSSRTVEASDGKPDRSHSPFIPNLGNDIPLL